MFSEKLKELRKSKKLTQEELGEILFVSRSAVAKWEQGKGIPNKESIKDICNYFNITKEELLEDNDVELVINNLQKDNKKTKLKLIIIFSCIIAVLLSIFIPITIFNSVSKNIVTYNKFYSEKTLEEFSVDDIEPIDFESSLCINQSLLSLDINKDYNKYQNYVNYVFNFLKESPSITSVYFLTNVPSSNIPELKTQYLVSSNNLQDYKEINKDRYTFCYTTNNFDSHKEKESIEVNVLSLSYGEIESGISLSETTYDMSMKLTKSENDIFDYYLIEEYFEYNQIKLDSKNYKNYLNINIHKSENLLRVNINAKQYYFLLNTKMKIDVEIKDVLGITTHSNEKTSIVNFNSSQQNHTYTIDSSDFNLSSLIGYNISNVKVEFIEDSLIHYAK